MDETGTYFDNETLQGILDRINKLTREGRPGDSDALIDEFGLREWLCGPV